MKTRNRDAAAVVLLRGDGADREVLLVSRAPELRFFGGYWALPGGVRDAVDHELGGERDEDSLRHCAMRELFEETGVLLADCDANEDERELVRRALLEGSADGWRTLLQAGRPLPITDICRIRTPPFSPVRYDTLFVLADLPPEQAPSVWSGELTEGRFWRPADALAAWRRGEVSIVPPVLILLQELCDASVDEFLAASRALADGYRRGALHRVQFSPGVIMASLHTETLPPATTTNCLIVGEDRFCVIDPAAADPDEQDRLATLVEELLAEGRALGEVLLTHHHPDHVGGVDAICRRFDRRVRGHAETLSRLAPPVPRGAPLNDGDRVALGTAPDGSPDHHLTAVFTPGHAPGHLCYLESRYRALVAGDMVSTVSTIIIDPPDGHLATYLSSLERLRELEVGVLYPAHGPAARQGSPVFEHYLRHRAARQRKLEAALQAPTRVADLLPVVYDDVAPELHAYAARSLLAGLQMLAEQGRATEREGVWHPLSGRS